ncbi:MAG: hypothetical protein OJF49_004551 [Ktedonobacterales bacterium]|nr:MAG: hypothetical protein OJF49_004551 [Ktedonobacterales bacterium]
MTLFWWLAWRVTIRFSIHSRTHPITRDTWFLRVTGYFILWRYARRKVGV